MSRPPLPPFTAETAAEKVRLAEDGWNTRDPERVALAYTPECVWRNRAEFIHGREQIVAFLRRKWDRELDYRLIKAVWAHDGNRIAVRFAYEWRDDSGQWFRSYGNENWEFDEQGLMKRRIASINDLPIRTEERKFLWPQGRRPDDHASLEDLELGSGVDFLRGDWNEDLGALAVTFKTQHGQKVVLVIPDEFEFRTSSRAVADTVASISWQICNLERAVYGVCSKGQLTETKAVQKLW